MYERFTVRVRRAMQAANQAAIRSNCGYISVEHILIGLLEDASCEAVRILKDQGISPEAVRSLVQASISPPNSPGAAKRALESAIEQARAIGSSKVGTEHLLLGILCESDSSASRILTDAGLTPSAAQNAIRAMKAARLLAEDEPAGQVVSGCSKRTSESIPAACPRCGDTSLVRILWSSTSYWDSRSQAQIEAGEAIAAGERGGMDLPGWSCLRCAPDWRKVQQLSARDHELQVSKEDAVAAHDFQRAADLRDLQEDVRRERVSLLNDLLARRELS